MKEFIDKLIERLEELQQCQIEKYTKSLDEGNLACIYDKTDIEDAKVSAVWKVLDIVIQLAEEYINCSTDISTKPTDYSTKVSEMPTGWIPCSERLPEKAGKYLVTINCGGDVHTTVRRFNPKPKHPKQNEPLFTKHIPLYSGWERRTCGVIAWKDLPAPYTEGE